VQDVSVNVNGEGSAGSGDDSAARRGAPTVVRLDVNGLTRRFGDLVALDAVSFTLEAGEVCAVTGPNGAGKTTLLRCVVGADRPDAGQVLLDGVPVDETDPSIRAAVASVLDDVDFVPDLSVVEHLELLGYAHGVADPPVGRLLAELALEPARDQLPATLSSGQRRRLALASCFVRPCRLLVLDEPEQRLDAQGLAWLAARLRQAGDDGVTVLLASHDHELVQAAADVEIEVGG
jgi:ABC-type multidrug transport system ATPase subunit